MKVCVLLLKTLFVPPCPPGIGCQFQVRAVNWVYTFSTLNRVGFKTLDSKHLYKICGSTPRALLQPDAKVANSKGHFSPMLIQQKLLTSRADQDDIKC